MGTALQRLTLPLKRRSRLMRRLRTQLATDQLGAVPGASGPAPKHYRTIFVSDTHLGTRGCKAEWLTNFLRSHSCETLFLVGDIIDGWRLKRSWYWPASHNDVVQEVLRKAREGTRIIYIPGNHDEGLRDYTGFNFGGVDMVFDTIYEMADGRKFLVMHGDHFDGVVMHAKWLALMGDWAYTVALIISDGLSAIRRRLGMPYWSLSAYLKYKVKNAVAAIGSFQQAIIREARLRKADGVICGHIHHAEMRMIDGVLYCNDGDWVESCTALVEDETGALRIIEWRESEKVLLVEPAKAAQG